MKIDNVKSFTRLELRRDIEVADLISAYHYSFPEGFTFEGERHEGWEFVYVESGRVAISADENKYILKCGEMVCHEPMEFHAIGSHGGPATVTVFCFDVAGEKMDYFRDKILSINQRQKLYINDIAANAELLLQRKEPLAISREGGMEKAPLGSVLNEQFIKNSIELLILSLYSSRSTEISSRAESYTQFTRRAELCESIKAYLAAHIGDPVTLADISAEFSYSVSTVKTVFKHETGKSIIGYLAALRMEEAKKQLALGKRSVTDIAEQLGFSSVYYFSGAFKKYTGTSPTAYSGTLRARHGKIRAEGELK